MQAKSLNIVLITESFLLSGVNTYDINIISTLAALGHNVYVITFNKSGINFPIPEGVKHHYQIDISNDRYFYLYQRIFPLARILSKLYKRCLIDCIVLGLVKPGLSFLIANRLLQLKSPPIIYQFHGSDALEKEYLEDFYKVRFRSFKTIARKLIDRYVINNCDHVIVFSDYSKRILLEELKIKTGITKIKPGREIINAAIVPNYSKGKVKTCIGFHPDWNIVLVVSRIEPRKGLFLFISSLKNVPRSFFKNTHIVLCSHFASDFSAYKFILQHANQRLGKRLIFINAPSRIQLFRLYQAADITVMPSIALETFGFVTLESMSVGTPVIAFDIGANKEIIDQEFLVPIRNPKKLPEKITIYLQKNQRDKKQISKDLIKKSSQYSWTTYTQALVDLINEKPENSYFLS